MRRFHHTPNLLSTDHNDDSRRLSASRHGSSRGSTTSDIGNSQRIILQREDIVDQMIKSEKYDIYTEEGYTALETDAEAVGESLGEYRKNASGKAKKSAL